MRSIGSRQEQLIKEWGSEVKGQAAVQVPPQKPNERVTAEDGEHRRAKRKPPKILQETKRERLRTGRLKLRPSLTFHQWPPCERLFEAFRKPAPLSALLARG